MAASADTVWKDMQERGVEFVFAQFVDMYARPSAKLVPVGSREAFDGLLEDGAGFAGFAAGEIGQQPSDPDIAAIPDLASYTPVPWQTNLARFACDVTVEGRGLAVLPAHDPPPRPRAGEGEGLRVPDGARARVLPGEATRRRVDRDRRPVDTLEKPCYDMAGLTRRYDFLTTVSRYCNGLGWGNYANDHEDANGQFEQNFTYDDALVSCDRAIFFRYMVHTLASRRHDRDLHAEAVLAPDGERVPLAHVAVGRRHEPVPRRGRPAGLGLSDTAYRFIGGLRTHAHAYSRHDGADRELVKRLMGSTASGATWSPVWISYGYNNRTQMLRIPGPGRIEDRTIDSSCNPCLAAAAMLAAGLDGIETGSMRASRTARPLHDAGAELR